MKISLAGFGMYGNILLTITSVITGDAALITFFNAIFVVLWIIGQLRRKDLKFGLIRKENNIEINNAKPTTTKQRTGNTRKRTV